MLSTGPLFQCLFILSFGVLYQLERKGGFLELFMNKGFAETTIEEITGVAGVARGSKG